MENRKLAIIIPCYNEQDALPITAARLREILLQLIGSNKISAESWILFVDDGSCDNTPDFLKELSGVHKEIRALILNANVGQQNALMAGLEYASGKCDAAITIDADLQDDPSIIPGMIEEWTQGADIVYGVRRSRKTDGFFKRNSAQLAYKLMRKLGAPTLYNHSDFRLLTSAMIRELLQYKERNLFIRGLVPMLGGVQRTVFYDRRPRCAGKTKYPLKRMVNFAADGITSFSMRPVRWVMAVGLLFLLTSAVMFIYVMTRYFDGETIEGWTSLMLSIWFCSGILLLSLGIIGEYIGKIYLEVKQRPRYNIREIKE